MDNPGNTTMDPTKKFPKNSRPFSFYLLLSMVILVICIVGFLTVNDYFYTRNNFNQESHLLQVQTEQNIRGAMRLEDYTWHVFDETLNDRMQTGLSSVLAEYERAGRDPASMNLTRLKTDLGGDYDIYVIDASGIIVQTSYGPEMGEDFKTFPDFYAYLTKIRNSEGFFPDRIVHELLGSGKFRKYAYMPTPDHKYVLELGLSSPMFVTMNQELDDQNLINQIVAPNPYVENFTIFNSVGRRVDDNRLPGEAVQADLKQVMATRSDLEVTDPRDTRTIRYLFVDIRDAAYGSDLSRVVEITYNTGMINYALTALVIFHLLFAAAAILLGCIAALYLSRRIARPIQEIVADADIIARGDLDHRIRDSQNREFAILGTSINTMVDSLRSAFQKRKDDEIFQKEMINRLPVGIFIKRAGDGRYVFWNRSCEELFHLPASHAIGKTDRELFPADVVVIIEKEDRQFSQNRQDLLNKIISSKYLGDRIIHLIIVPIFDSTGTLQYILGISTDVSHENINLKMDLLFSITRHDILDNLSVIMSHLERAQLKNTPDDMQKFFDKTIGSIEAIRNQIASTRVLQEVGLVSPKWQPLEPVFYEAASLLPEPRAAIRAELDHFAIFADPLLLRVFYTLLENSLRSEGKQASRIRLSAYIENGALHLIYEDNGNGIPAAEKEKIFEGGSEPGPFRGLFLIREILGFTRITITENGEPGKGVRFDIEVPEGKFRKVT